MIAFIKIGFLNFSLVDFIDIFLVSLLLYQLYKLLRGSVAVKIFIGLLSIVLLYLIVKAAKMELLSSILGQFTGVGVLAAIILFQQEIRKFLLLVGKTTIFNNENFLFVWPWNKRAQMRYFNITPIIEAVKTMGGSNTGALIVFSKNSELKFYAESGDILDSVLSKRLLISIFNKYSPLHDGAVIVYKNRIKAARCVLPVSENDSLPASMGLRHRAALGMSENTDTLVLVVSEETGQFSIARNGKIYSNLSPTDIRYRLNRYLFEEEEEEKEDEEGGKEVPLFTEDNSTSSSEDNSSQSKEI
ncbi:MAG: diadenylate cyclase CdaA [Cytophagales bacterium]